MLRRRGESPWDWWTVPHAAAGAALGLLGMGWPWALAVILGFELVEAGLRRVKHEGKGLFEYESWPNIAADVVVAVAAFAVARYLLPFEGPLAG